MGDCVRFDLLPRNMIRHLKAATKRWMQRRGFKIERTMRPFLDHPGALISPTFDQIASYHAVKTPDFFFIQVGANDGIAHDPIRRYVTQLKWRGVLIEPQASVFRALVENYRACAGLQFLNVAIAETDGIKTLYSVRTDQTSLPAWANELASFSLATILSHRALIPDIDGLIRKEPVKAITFKTLFATLQEPKVDLLQIDVEGYDFEVLKLLDFSVVRPAIIHFEHGHLNEKDLIASFDLLIGQGYRLALEDRDTTAYHESHLLERA